MNEPDLQASIIRAEKARLLLDNDILSAALDSMEREVVELWGQAPTRDKEGKEELWRLYKTQQKFRMLLLGYIESGKYAQAQLAQYEKESKLRSLFRAA